MSRKIAIHSRYLPFSHKVGVCCLVPHTSWEVTVYPTKLLFCDVFNTTKKEALSLPLEGPIEGFTVIQNLEKGQIEVRGKEKGKHPFSYCITSSMVFFSSPIKNRYPLAFKEIFSPQSPLERLSLGIHKKQDWEKIIERMDMAEIFPFWIALAQHIPFEKTTSSCGVLSLLQTLPPPLLLVSEFKKIVRVGFEGLLAPRLFDEKYQGILPEEKREERIPSSLSMVHQGAALIRSVFFEEKESSMWRILGGLPPQFHAGRYVDLKTSFGATVCLEWAKKKLQKMEVRTQDKGCAIQFVLPKGSEMFRWRQNYQQKGKLGDIQSPFSLTPFSTYIFDRFSSYSK